MPRAPTDLLEKHREEKPNYAVDFDSYLATGESLSGTPVVEVELLAGGVWDDVSGQFTPGNIAISGTNVNFHLIVAASGTDQLAGEDYRVKVTVTTDGGQTRVTDNPLHVYA